MQRNRMAVTAACLALAAAITASVLLLFVPFYEGAMTDPTTGQSVKTTATLIEMNGWRVIIPLAIPPILTAGGLIGTQTRRELAWVTASLLVIFTFITGFSIGKFYTPAAGLLTAAAILAQSRGTRD